MSWQAFEAVQDHSKIDDHTGMSIMYVIARYADATGAVGAGGRITSPSIDTIATKSRCHRNTVLNWLPKLEATGELTIERLGSGRGSWNRYNINLPMPVPEENNGTSKDVPLSKDMVQEMVQKVGVMVQDAMAEMKVMVHDMVHNGTSHIVLDTKDTNTYKSINGKNGISHSTGHPEQVNQIIMALESVAKTVFDSDTEAAFVDAAWRIIGWDGTPEQVRGFADWWKTNGGYSGLPALKSVMTEYRNYVSGVTKVQASNGTVNTATDSAGGFYG